jgi:hypothetical protein
MPHRKDLSLLLLLVILSLNSLKGQDKGWRGYYNSAEAAIENGQYHTAAKRFEQASLLKPTNKLLAFNAGKYYVIARDYEKAIQFLEPLKTKTKTYPKVLYYLGMAEKARGNYDEALVAFSVFSSDYVGADKSQIIRFVENEIKGCEIGRAQQSVPADSIEVILLDEQVNSSANEVAPIPINEDLLYFSSNVKGNVSLFKSTRDEEGHWSEPSIPETLPLVRKSNFCHGSFSPDYTKFYFTVCSDFEGEWREDELKCSIYYSELIGNSWTEARALGRFINLPGAINIQPFVTYEGKDEVVYFVSNRSGGYGGMDIWYIKKPIREGINSFGYPVNAGKNINSPSNEMSPYYDLNEATLFFSTDGRPGLGGMDIYAAVGSMENWLDVYALGAPLNSSYDDLYYRPLDSEQGFFVSNRPMEPFRFNTVDNDIFYYKHKQAEPDSFQFNAAILAKKSEEVIDLAEIEIYEVLGEEDFELIETLLLSSYNLQLLLETGKEYLIITKKDGYEQDQIIVDSESVEHSINIYLEEEQLMPSIELEEPVSHQLIFEDPDVVHEEMPSSVSDTPVENLIPKDEFRIQIAAVKNVATIDVNSLNSYGNVVYEKIEGKELYRILIRGFEKKADAEEKLKQMRKDSTSFSSAFIVKYSKGKRN